LRAEFQIKREVISREAEKWQAIIASEDSIALHVRRSSYERKCSAEYYINAVRKLRAEQPRAKVFIFADDHRWVTENLLPFFEASPIQIESETSDLEEFWLMTTCRHFIIANSTYSWWAAWLGSYAEKRVVAPRDGWCKGKTVVKDLLPPEWETVRGRERTLESETQGMEEKPKRFRHRALRLLKAYATLGQFIHSTTLLGDDLQALTAQTLSFHDGFLRPLQVEDELASLLGDVKALNPATVLEIGTAQGGTLYLWTRLAREDALVVSVDLPGGKFGGGYSRLRIPIYRRFARARQALHLLRANSHDPSTLAKVKKLFGARPIDLLFIDGDHTYEGVKQDWEMYSPLVRSGGLVVFHDISGNYGDTEVKKYWDSIRPAYNHKEYSHYPGGKCGIGVLVK
jgi:predicted O-methyltransferase YrrM